MPAWRYERGIVRQPHPQADERQVEHQQHDVADVEARNQAPHELGIARKSSGPGCRPYC